jgi:TolA-binding protein
MAFCPDCGEELKAEYKFCPSCGYNLQDTGDIRQSSHTDSTETEVVICDNCGTENPAGTEVCEGCGVRLSRDTKVVKKQVPQKAQIEKKYSRKKATKEKEKLPKGSKVSTQNVKEIDSKKILGIIVAVVGGCFIILLAAGVFDKPVSSSVNTNVTQNQGSGVDLSDLQKINELEERVKNNPDDAKSLLDLAHLRNDSGMFEKAIEDYQKYLKIVPSDADARVDMGVCYYSLRRYDEAIKEMKKALEYKPDHQIAHLNLGIVNLAAGNIDKSREWLRKAVNLNPNSEVGKRAQELLSLH